MLSLGLSLLATCIRLFTVIYGYVILVAASFPNAPNRKISRGKTLLLFSSTFLNCSKIVYCNIGLITSTSAGNTPANNAVGPSSLKSLTTVANVEGFFVGLLPGSVSSVLFCLAVMRVLTTQIGFVSSTVALPARAPAIMDSTVVSFLEARPARIAARSKAARVHSYPGIRLAFGALKRAWFLMLYVRREEYSNSTRNS